MKHSSPHFSYSPIDLKNKWRESGWNEETILPSDSIAKSQIIIAESSIRQDITQAENLQIKVSNYLGVIYRVTCSKVIELSHMSDCFLSINRNKANINFNDKCEIELRKIFGGKVEAKVLKLGKIGANLQIVENRKTKVLKPQSLLPPHSNRSTTLRLSLLNRQYWADVELSVSPFS